MDPLLEHGHRVVVIDALQVGITTRIAVRRVVNRTGRITDKRLVENVVVGRRGIAQTIAQVVIEGKKISESFLVDVGLDKKFVGSVVLQQTLGKIDKKGGPVRKVLRSARNGQVMLLAEGQCRGHFLEPIDFIAIQVHQFIRSIFADGVFELVGSQVSYPARGYLC